MFGKSRAKKYPTYLRFGHMSKKNLKDLLSEWRPFSTNILFLFMKIFELVLLNNWKKLISIESQPKKIVVVVVTGGVVVVVHVVVVDPRNISLGFG